VDEQARGPFSRWRHTHTFLETSEGTEVRDQVDYRLPLRFLGQVAHAMVVKRQLLGIFRYRQHRVAAMLAVPGIVYAEPAAGPLIA
jgi:ligand-binding SRPBCC domain-containing protein